MAYSQHPHLGYAHRPSTAASASTSVSTPYFTPAHSHSPIGRAVTVKQEESDAGRGGAREDDEMIGGGEEGGLAVGEGLSTAGSRQLKNTKRAAQNRAAQRAFRERKDRYVRDLEARSARLEEFLARTAQLEERERRCEERERGMGISVGVAFGREKGPSGDGEKRGSRGSEGGIGGEGVAGGEESEKVRILEEELDRFRGENAALRRDLEALSSLPVPPSASSSLFSASSTSTSGSSYLNSQRHIPPGYPQHYPYTRRFSDFGPLGSGGQLPPLQPAWYHPYPGAMPPMSSHPSYPRCSPPPPSSPNHPCAVPPAETIAPSLPSSRRSSMPYISTVSGSPSASSSSGHPASRERDREYGYFIGARGESMRTASGAGAGGQSWAPYRRDYPRNEQNEERSPPAQAQTLLPSPPSRDLSGAGKPKRTEPYMKGGALSGVSHPMTTPQLDQFLPSSSAPVPFSLSEPNPPVGSTAMAKKESFAPRPTQHAQVPVTREHLKQFRLALPYILHSPMSSPSRSRSRSPQLATHPSQPGTAATARSRSHYPPNVQGEHSSVSAAASYSHPSSFAPQPTLNPPRSTSSTESGIAVGNTGIVPWPDGKFEESWGKPKRESAETSTGGMGAEREKSDGSVGAAGGGTENDEEIGGGQMWEQQDSGLPVPTEKSDASTPAKDQTLQATSPPPQQKPVERPRVDANLRKPSVVRLPLPPMPWALSRQPEDSPADESVGGASKGMQGAASDYEEGFAAAPPWRGGKEGSSSSSGLGLKLPPLAEISKGVVRSIRSPHALSRERVPLPHEGWEATPVGATRRPSRAWEDEAPLNVGRSKSNGAASEQAKRIKLEE